MKLYKYCLAFLALTTVTVSGCKNEDINEEHHYDNKLYVSSTPVCDDLLIKPSITEATREISYRIASPAEQDIQISFDAAPAMTAAYNLIYNDNATALDARFYSIPNKTATIKAGDVSSDNIVIDFKNTNELDKSKRYVLPVTILDASNIEVLESARTAYFIFKGAALINVVADLTKNLVYVNWGTPEKANGLRKLTVEVLVNPSKLDKAISTVLGIEGYFLLDGAEIPEGADEDEFDRLPANHVLDMESLVVAAIVFELPLVPLCDEDCKGLCPTCGANLNEGPCGCEKEQSDGPDEFELAKNPFAALANFSFDSDESVD